MNRVWIPVGPSESLFSICSRLHFHYGYSSGIRTSEYLFGAKNAAYWSDAPRSVSRFLDVVGSSYGGVDGILKRTTSGLLLRMQPSHRAAAPAARHAEVSRGFRRGTKTYTRLCPECARVDQESLGVSVWRVEHDFEGVLMCGLHAVPLVWHGMRSALRDQWFRPKDAGRGVTHDPGRHRPFALNYARTIKFLLATPEVDDEGLRRIVFSALLDANLIRSPAKPHTPNLKRWWDARRRALLAAMDYDSVWLARGLVGRIKLLPEEWAMVSALLVDSVDLLDRLREVRIFQPALDGFEVSGYGFQSLAGLPTGVWSALMEGQPISKLAESTGITPAALRYWLRSDPVKKKVREKNRALSALMRRRSAVELLLQEDPDLTRADLFARAGAEVRWLESYDQSWIRSRLRSPHPKRFVQAALDF